jgi:hypothetical protein
MDEVVIETSSMFAKTVLGIEDQSRLCPFLQELDEEETRTQEIEQQEIQKKRLEVKAGLNATAAMGVAGVSLFALGGPILGFILSAGAGAIAALISDNTDAFGNATPMAIKNLNLHKKRTVRLEDKVKKIATARVAQGQEQTVLGQLARTEESFSRTISRYRAWERNV